MQYIKNPDPNTYVFNTREDKTIYLGVSTNIICIDDRPKNFKSFYSSVLYQYQAMVNRAIFRDKTATLYLGKIIFEVNKAGNLTPQYIPNKITESSFDDLNLFWLNEVNSKRELSISTTKNLIAKLQIDKEFDWIVVNPDGYKYLNISYFRTPKNIVLTKKQIKSYFTELHTKNTAFIKNFIDSIHENKGLKGYYLTDKVFEQLTQLGILNQEKQHHYKERQLIALDYMVKTNLYRIIPYFDELFYPYLVWSLQDFLLPYYTLKYQEKYNRSFNLGAYKDYTIDNLDSSYKEYSSVVDMSDRWEYKFEYLRLFYDTIYPSTESEGYIEDYRTFHGYHNLSHIALKLPKPNGHKCSSPNHFYNLSSDGSYSLDEFEEMEIKGEFDTISSPLGNYYFELSDNKDTFLQFYPRIYPSIENPPKGWSKEMMQKLDLRLERFIPNRVDFLGDFQ